MMSFATIQINKYICLYHIMLCSLPICVHLIRRGETTFYILVQYIIYGVGSLMHLVVFPFDPQCRP